ncbi:hypothetical protein GCM10011494_34230 [Novosphingobium endophyticum]|uniref:PD-(D/E)XK motif protein n=1 Tax=Novosphingobium endophyticum TaxID=1955250 RepID=A0A916TV26_9SPHN|nr:PD-(D/E)XK motif protein [Novosphingobium endophyticum]GGC12563.1 hypothetical protein GCM10011494_34230 [Novosphingobium endophyticum]
MLFEAYSKLVQAFPDGCDHLYGEAIHPSGNLWLATDGQLYPALLFAGTPSDERGDIRLRAIDVEFSRDCEIAVEASIPVLGTFTIVRLNESDPEIVRVFLRLLEESFCERQLPVSNREIGDRILEIAELFSRIDGGGDIVGLWGELYLISLAPSVTNAVRCWSSHKSAKYDFVTDQFALETKTTLKPSRQHRFSIDQLRPGLDMKVYLASLQLTETQAGRTVAELVEEIYGELADAELRNAFFSLCLSKGGPDIYRSSLRLRPFPDESSLMFFDARELPAPEVGASDPIANVRFDLDLSAVQPLGSEARGFILSFPA